MEILARGRRLAIVLLAPFFVLALPAQAQYQAIDLGPIPGTPSFAIGAGGNQQVGFTETPDGTGASGLTQAALWTGSPDSFVNLHPVTATVSQATAAAGGQQVGFADSAAVLWDGTADSMVSLHPAGFFSSQALGIGDGQQVGCGNQLVTAGRGVSQPGPNHALLWSGTAASVVDLHVGSGFDQTCAFGVSQGHQVGAGVKGRNTLAVIWNNTAKSVTSLHPDKGFINSTALAVSGAQQVGWGQTAAFVEPGVERQPISRFHALMWTGNKATVVDLHTAGGPFKDTQALGVGSGLQVGFGFDSQDGSAPQAALVWAGTAASVVNLNQFLPVEFVSAKAFAIDPTTGVISGAATTDTTDFSQWHAFIWVPVAAAAVKSH